MLPQLNFKQIFALVLFALNYRIVNSGFENYNKEDLIKFNNTSKHHNRDNEEPTSHQTFYNCNSIFCKGTFSSYFENDYVCTLDTSAKIALCSEVYKALIHNIVIIKSDSPVEYALRIENDFKKEPCVKKKINLKDGSIEHPMMKCSLRIVPPGTEDAKYLLYYISRTYRTLGLCGKYKIFNCKTRNFYIYQNLGEVKRVKNAMPQSVNNYEALSSKPNDVKFETVELVAETNDIDLTKLKLPPPANASNNNAT